MDSIADPIIPFPMLDDHLNKKIFTKFFLMRIFNWMLKLIPWSLTETWCRSIEKTILLFKQDALFFIIISFTKVQMKIRVFGRQICHPLANIISIGLFINEDTGTLILKHNNIIPNLIDNIKEIEKGCQGVKRI